MTSEDPTHPKLTLAFSVLSANQLGVELLPSDTGPGFNPTKVTGTIPPLILQPDAQKQVRYSLRINIANTRFETWEIRLALGLNTPTSPADPCFTVQFDHRLSFERTWLTTDLAPGGPGKLDFAALEAIPLASLITQEKQTDQEELINTWLAAPLNKVKMLLEIWGADLKSLILPNIQLRKRFEVSNIARIWPHLADFSNNGQPPNSQKGHPKDQLEILRSHYEEYLKQYFRQRLYMASDPDFPHKHQADDPEGYYADYDPHPCDFEYPPDNPNPPVMESLCQEVTGRCIESLAGFAQRYFASQVQSPASALNNEDDTPTARPHPVVLQIGSLSATTPGKESAGNPDLDDIILRQLSGIGLLVRRKTGRGLPDNQWGDWRCLTMATIQLRPDTESGKQYLVETETVIPYRIVFSDHLSQVFIAYDNQPLIAESPAKDLIPQKIPKTSPLYKYVLPPRGERKWSLMPPLVFGHLYQFLPFLIGTCGNLPAPLARDSGLDTVVPFEIADFEQFKTNVASFNQNNSSRIREVPYLRRVGVGQPRFIRPDGTPDDDVQAALPAIPETVHPLAKEIAPPGQLHAQSSLNSRQYFFYDAVAGCGTLDLGNAEWEITMNGVTAARLGALDPCFKFVIRIPADDDPKSARCGGAFSFVLRWERALTIRAHAYLKGMKPGKAEAKVVDWGPVDLRVAFSSSSADPATGPGEGARENSKAWKLQFAWRRTGAPVWTSLPMDFPLTTPPLPMNDIFLMTRYSACASDSSQVLFETPQAAIMGQLIPAEKDPELPLLLLNPWTKQGSFSFRVGKPSCEIHTWERWVADDTSPRNRDRRDRVWAAFHELEAKRHLQAGRARSGTANHNFPDDPAAAPGLVLGLRLLYPQKKDLVPQQLRFFPFPQQAPALDHNDITTWIRSEQNPGLRIECTMSGDDAVSHLPIMEKSNLHGREGVRVTLAPGQVAELLIYTPIPKPLFDEKTGRFHSALSKGCPVFTDSEQGAQVEYCLISPFRMMIEAPIAIPDGELDRQDLMHALWQAIHPATEGNRLVVRFLRPPETDPWDPKKRRFDYFSQIEVMRQVWRWQGRALSPFPFQQPAAEINQQPNDLKDSIRHAFLWDAEGFAEHQDADHLLSRHLLNLRHAAEDVYTEAIDGEKRAMYYRFGARFVSRYKGLVPGDREQLQACRWDEVRNLESRSGAAVPEIHALGRKGRQLTDAWRRLLLRSRFSGILRPPRPRLVMPLMAAALPEKASAAGHLRSPELYAVFDDPGYEEGGLAEVMEAEVEYVKAPVDGQSPETVYAQLGPDPILSGEGLPWVASATTHHPPIQIDISPKFLLGHTHDSSDMAPLITATSVLVPPPQIFHPAEDDSDSKQYEAMLQRILPWSFARISFRRHLLLEGLETYRLEDHTLTVSNASGGEEGKALTTAPIDLTCAQDWALELAQLAWSPDFSGAPRSLNVVIRDEPTLSDQSEITLTVTVKNDRWNVHVAYDKLPLIQQSFTIASHDSANAAAEKKPATVDSTVKPDLRLLISRIVLAGQEQDNTVRWRFRLLYRINQETWIRSMVKEHKVAPAVPNARNGHSQAAGIPFRHTVVHLNLGGSPGDTSLSLKGPLLLQDFYSEPTPPVWVQYLPDSSQFLTSKGLLEARELAIDWSADEPRLTWNYDSIALATRPHAAPPATSEMASPLPLNRSTYHKLMHWVLLTRQVSDAGGDAGTLGQANEQYLGTCLVDRDGTLLSLEGFNNLPGDKEKIQARIIELQGNLSAINQSLDGSQCARYKDRYALEINEGAQIWITDIQHFPETEKADCEFQILNAENLKKCLSIPIKFQEDDLIITLPGLTPLDKTIPRPAHGFDLHLKVSQKNINEFSLSLIPLMPFGGQLTTVDLGKFEWEPPKQALALLHKTGLESTSATASLRFFMPFAFPRPSGLWPLVFPVIYDEKAAQKHDTRLRILRVSDRLKFLNG